MKYNQDKIILGNLIAEKIFSALEDKIAGFNFKPCMAVFNFRPDPVVDKYLKIKKRFGDRLGISIIIEDNHQLSFLEAKKKIKDFGDKKDVQGLVVQLPLPKDWPIEELLSLIPKEKDPDCLSGKCQLLPPVARAVKEILDEYKIDIKGKKVAVVGRGRLVGRPVEEYFRKVDCQVEVVCEGDNLAEKLKGVSLIVSGVGKKHIITPNIIEEGVILIDAGLSEAEGSIFGDIDPACLEKAELFSLAKNGLGPVAVACLFANFVELLE